MMKHRHTFREVLGNCDDQVIVREMLNAYVNSATKNLIVVEFNAHADRYNARVAKLEAEEKEESND